MELSEYLVEDRMRLVSFSKFQMCQFVGSVHRNRDELSSPVSFHYRRLHPAKCVSQKTG